MTKKEKATQPLNPGPVTILQGAVLVGFDGHWAVIKWRYGTVKVPKTWI